MPQVASNPTIHAADRHLPRVAHAVQNPERPPSPFEDLLQETAAAPEAPASQSELKPPFPGSSRPVKSPECNAAKANADEPPPAPVDQVAETAGKSEGGTTIENTVLASAESTLKVADENKPTDDQQGQAEQHSKDPAAPPCDASALTASPPDAAPTPVAASTQPAVPENSAEPDEPVLQVPGLKDKALLTEIDVPPKISTGKQPGKAENVEGDTQIDLHPDVLAELADAQTGVTTAHQPDAKLKASSSHNGVDAEQARNQAAPSSDHRVVLDAAARRDDAPDSPLPNPNPDVHPAVTTTPHASQHAAAPATLVSQPGPQPAAVPLEGVAIQIAAKAHAGKNRFEIRLDPPELGRIDVRLDVDRDGKVTSRLIVDRVETLDLLRRDASGLERALQEAGLKTSDNGLQFSLRDKFVGQQLAEEHSDPAHLIALDEVSTIDQIPQNYPGRLGHGVSLDIRV
ncbi:MAG TPA: flagellar hook-length control protein FliK [Pseudolabrys sp.]|nr:flagellar hook-length control protein FliK [Pseudolabrys sp.]